MKCNIFELAKENCAETVIRPFWSWNDKLEADELCEQIDKMKNANIGGFFMHARGGLQTEYMSDEWFEMIDACLNKADKNNMQAWAYDENGWPSGFANGFVPAQSVEYQQKFLKLTKIENGAELPENILGIYRVLDDSVEKISDAEDGAIAISYEVNPYYIDTFNSEAIACFIGSTHEKYYNHFKERFGTSLKGFFTDEPQYANGGLIPWSNVFLEKFKEKYGYSITDELVCLFVDGEFTAKFRYDYYLFVSELFQSSFIKQMYDWCSDHNCELTGHMMNEDNLVNQMFSTAGVMPCYEYFHIPGIDWLCRKIGSVAIPKQLGSVAAQLQKPTLTETFALCGWDVSFNELKWIAEWQLVNGITSLCQHLQGYTLRGFRKRDYPASLFIQQPWFEDAYGYFNKYFTMLGALLLCGEEVAPVLIIYPLQTAYVTYNPSNLGTTYEVDNAFRSVTDTFTHEHISHHYGDEAIMERHAVVSGNILKIGACEYKDVVLPSIKTISENTFKLLLDFAKNGGAIYSVGDLPTMINGRFDQRLSELINMICKTDINDFCQKVDYSYRPSISENDKECEDIQCRIRILENGTLVYYLVNLSQENRDVTLSLNGSYSIKELDVVNEKESYINHCVSGEKTIAQLHFAPMGSYVLLVENSSESSSRNTQKCEEIMLSPNFEILKIEPNALTLDTCMYKIDNGEWQDAKAIILIQNELLKLKRTCNVELKFSFCIEDISASNNLQLVLECPEKYQISINGKEFVFEDKGYYTDKSFRKTDISSYVVLGENTVILKTNFYQNENVYRVLFTPGVHEVEFNKLTYDTELESIYLLGDFCVSMQEPYTYGERRAIFGGKTFALTAPSKKLDITDITPQGYWFFSGKMELVQTVSINKQSNVRYVVKLGSLNAPAAKLFINGEDAGLFAFAPFCIDVSELIKNGDNEIKIVLYSGNRNLLGPHHRPCGESYAVGPGTFTDEYGWSDDRSLPSWTDNYNFVRFGAQL